MNLPSAEEIQTLPPDGGSEFNRLIFESSPYLLQHARNPVDWYPWGEAAFEKAKREDKPIFLSVGYATCHWCHVMEHESFEDSAVAALMNEYFVSIKVDREERPDVDQIYMAVTQALTGHGGWPMTVVMTWDRKPFFAGTYFPKETRHGRMGMLDLVPTIGTAWKNRRDEILESADKITAILHESVATEPSELDAERTMDNAFAMLSQQFDPINGGFGRSPKFPTPHHLVFLMRYARRHSNDSAMRMVEKTLQSMRRGGIYDHVGFGFHRYSTDERWFLPHFEKMLYDQALLAMAYTEAYAVTKKDEYKKTADEIFNYVLRDMTDPDGGFYSAEDADSEGEEGKFYLWTETELANVLGEDDARLWQRMYNTQPDGNYREEATGHATGGNIFYLNKDWDVLAAENGWREEELRNRLESIRRKLFDVREKRVHPLKDDKILTDWNGLMIAALARAARTMESPAYESAAQKATDFILTHLRDSDGRLMKRYRRGKSGLPAHLDDYAMLTWGLIELYEAGFDLKYLEAAMELQEIMIREFWDGERGGFYFSRADDGELITRMKEIYDGAIPSGNSVAAMTLLRLARMTGRTDWEEKSHRIGQVFAENIRRAPMAYTQFLQTLDFAPSYEIVVVGDRTDKDTQSMLRAIELVTGRPKVVLLKTPDNADRLAELSPFTKSQTARDGRTTVYVCENFSCNAPTTDIDEMVRLLKR